MSSADITDVYEIPKNGGRRAGAGRPKGYSPKRARQMEADGLVDDTPDGADDRTLTAVKFASARARHEAAKADNAELEFKVKSGEYVPVAMVAQVVATAVAGMAQNLRSIPDNLERRGLAGNWCAIVEEVVTDSLAQVAKDFEVFAGPAEVGDDD